MMRFEDQITVRGGYENKEFFVAAWEKARDSVERGRIKEEDFVDIYDEEEIRADLVYVEETEAILERKRREQSEDKETRMASDIFEALISSQIELSDWFGSDVLTQQASRYDDLKNGVDTIYWKLGAWMTDSTLQLQLMSHKESFI